MKNNFKHNNNFKFWSNDSGSEEIIQFLKIIFITKTIENPESYDLGFFFIHTSMVKLAIMLGSNPSVQGSSPCRSATYASVAKLVKALV